MAQPVDWLAAWVWSFLQFSISLSLIGVRKPEFFPISIQ